MAIYVGIDPGKSGGFGVYDTDTGNSDWYKMPGTIHEIADIFRKFVKWCDNNQVYIVMEKVHSMPGQGVASTFTFGQNFGWLEGMIASFNMACIEVTPNKWMRIIGTMPKEKADRKKHIKDWVEKRIGRSVPLYIADAIAISLVAPEIWRTR